MMNSRIAVLCVLHRAITSRGLLSTYQQELYNSSWPENVLHSPLLNYHMMALDSQLDLVLICVSLQCTAVGRKTLLTVAPLQCCTLCSELSKTWVLFQPTSKNSTWSNNIFIIVSLPDGRWLSIQSCIWCLLASISNIFQLKSAPVTANDFESLVGELFERCFCTKSQLQGTKIERLLSSSNLVHFLLLILMSVCAFHVYKAKPPIFDNLVRN